jgi:hypothetical protein
VRAFELYPSALELQLLLDESPNEHSLVLKLLFEFGLDELVEYVCELCRELIELMVQQGHRALQEADDEIEQLFGRLLVQLNCLNVAFMQDAGVGFRSPSHSVDDLQCLMQ